MPIYEVTAWVECATKLFVEAGSEYEAQMCVEHGADASWIISLGREKAWRVSDAMVEGVVRHETPDIYADNSSDENPCYDEDFDCNQRWNAEQRAMAEADKADLED